MAGEESTGTVSFPVGAGQPQSQSSANPESGNGAAASYLTREEAARLREDLMREVQSRTDKASSRVDKKIKDQLAELSRVTELQRASGLEVDETQLARVRQRIYDNAYLQTDESPAAPSAAAAQPPNPGTQQPSSDPVAEFVNNRINRLFQKYQVEVTEDEARAAGLMNITDPHAFLDKLEDLAVQKAKAAATSPGARIPTMGQGTATNLQAQYQTELAAIPRGQNSIKARQELRIKYQKLGLNV